jgi:outer membrane protein TolC
MKKSFILFIFFLPLGLMAQDSLLLDLNEAYAMAIKNYPITRQKDLISKTSALNIQNLSSGFWPQVSLNGQASYQSAVTEVPIKIPTLQFDPLSKDQYRAAVDVSQMVYDGGQTKSQRAILKQQQLVDEQKVDVEYQKLKERINDLWFSVLFVDEQSKLLELSQQDIHVMIKKLHAQVQQGTAFKSALANLQAEKLKNDQRMAELKYSRKALLDVLGVFIGKELSAAATLKYPEAVVADSTNIRRPELELIKRQMTLTEEQVRLIDLKKAPRVSAFAQGGYGRPGLNMLVNEFDFFYIGGVRLNWNLSGFYNNAREKQINQFNREFIGIQADQLMMNIRADLKRYHADLDKYRELIRTDNDIIMLRKQVSDASAAQLENGVITSSDYLRELNAEEQSRRNQALHNLQLLQTIINYKTTTGN